MNIRLSSITGGKILFVPTLSKKMPRLVRSGLGKGGGTFGCCLIFSF